MVVPSISGVAGEFQSLIDDQEFVGLAAVSTLTAVGGAIAQQISRFTLSTLGRAPRPSSATGLATSGFLKVAIGAVHGFLAMQVEGMAGALLAITGLGAAVVGGGDIINLLLGQLNSGTGESSAPVGNGRVKRVQQAAADVGSNGSGSRTATTTANNTSTSTVTGSQSMRDRRDGAVTS